MQTPDPQKTSDHHRRSVRLKGYDYGFPGAYFVTLVAKDRGCLFSEVVEGEVRLLRLGLIIQEEWMNSIKIRSEIRLFEDQFIIMPNHLHGIVWIISSVGADGVRPYDIVKEGARRAPLPLRPPRSLGSFVAGFKASVTSRAIHELGIKGLWQRNYYEHIIRNEVDLRQIHEYILDNPRRWEEDEYHPPRLQSLDNFYV